MLELSAMQNQRIKYHQGKATNAQPLPFTWKRVVAVHTHSPIPASCQEHGAVRLIQLQEVQKEDKQ